MKNIEQIIKNTNEENESRVDWTKEWSTKYGVLKTYKNNVNVTKYSEKIRSILTELQHEYGYDELNSMLILKDILYHEWKDKK